jgi:predicted HTH transcriptional regulator
MQKYFLPRPEYINENKIVTLILKNNTISDNRVLTEQKRLLIEKEFNKLQDTSKIIILELSQNNGINLKDLSSKLDISERTIRDHLKKLLDK